MRKRVRLVAIICIMIAGIAGVCACANLVAAQTSSTGSVTVFTDGLAMPGGAISQAVVELSAELEKSGKIRLLPIMGHGGPANIRDLLRLRGTDLAVLNSDALAAPELAKNHPGYKEKLRYVTKLRSQKVILLARREVETVERLGGKKVIAFGPEGMTGFTARTVFASLGIAAEVTSHFDKADEAQLGQADAIFLFDADANRLPPTIARSGDLHLVPVPLSPPLAKLYRAAQVQLAPGEEPVGTIETDTILASFNWLAQHGRYGDVTAFIDGFFAALPNLRSKHPSSIWNETDPRAAVSGWRQYGPAAAAAKSVPAPQPGSAAPVPAFVSSVEDTAGDARLRLSILAQPPLTDERGSEGGLLTQLAKAALQRTDWPQAANVDLHWESDRARQAHGLLVEKRTELALPWSGPSCDEPAQLTGEAAAICDGVLLSEPIFKALVVFFTAAESGFDASSPERLSGRTICVPTNRDFTPPTEAVARLARDGQLKLVRPASMIDCLTLVGRGDADALLANELEGKRVIADLGLSQAFRVVENAGFAQQVRIIVAKSAPNAEGLLNALNQGIAKLKADAAYQEIVMRHLVPLNRSATAR